MGSCSSKTDGPIPPFGKKEFPHLSERDDALIQGHYDVIVIGSGYGGGIAASRAARAGKSVCVLERGKEWRPGDFPEEFKDVSSELRLKVDGCETKGNKLGLYEFIVSKDVSVFQGCGLGGTSLINASVCLEADEQVFDDDAWPQDLQDDMANFKLDMERAKTMLKPAPYHKETAKQRAFGKIAKAIKDNPSDIEDIAAPLVNAAAKKPTEELHYKTPINVTNHRKYETANHVGISQPECNGCGGCMTGCNTGAKNVVGMNYLPDAKYHGAEIFTRVSVESIQQLEVGYRWQVSYRRYHGDDLEEVQVVRANFVFLGAGSLGSTAILKRSKEEGLNVSDMVGKGFSGNGDQLGIAWANDDPSHVLGVAADYGKEEAPKVPGPTVTSVLDLRGLKGEVPYDKQLVIEDSSVAKGLIPVYKALLYLLSPLMGQDFDKSDDWEQFVDMLKGEDIEKSCPMLAMSHDHVGADGKYSSGEIVLDEDGVRIDWSGVGENPNYHVLDQIYKLAAKALGGKLLPYPAWSDFFKSLFKGRGTVTVHPLGGCNMAESGVTGVVNHKGQVFAGNTGNVLPGLYVVDGAVIPRSVGVNPLLTICGVAERCTRLLAEDEKWTVDNEFEEHPEKINWTEKKRPGLRTIEVMKGEVRDKKGKKTYESEFRQTLFTNDAEYMLDKDPEHKMMVDGVFTCGLLSKKPLTVKGTLRMFVPDSGPDSVVSRYHMYYDLKLYPRDSKKVFFFEGDKNIYKDSHHEMLGIVDTTNLEVTIHKGENKSGDILGSGKLTMPVTELIKSATSNLQLTNIKGGHTQELRLKKKFYDFFLGQTYSIYSPISSSQMTLGDARLKRPLNLPEKAQPVVYKLLTEDKQVRRLVRYQGGHKGPVLLIHGHGTSSILFTLDTVRENFVEFLVKHNYDVWTLDWRADPSQHFSRVPYTFDEVVQNDIAPAVDKILEVTQHKDIEVVAHCFGCEVFWMCMLSGQLEGKIRCVASSQVAITPIPSTFNRFKTGISVAQFFENIGIEATDNYDEDREWMDKLYEKFSKVMADVLLDIKNECKNSVCHKLTFAYGLLWEHRQLNNDTHRTLHELFGQASLKSFVHLSKVMAAGRLVGFENDDLYMPGYSGVKEKRLSSDAYMERMKRCDVPQLLVGSELNSVYKCPENTQLTQERLIEAFPEHANQFESFVVKDYGHLDTFMGKNANRDVFPRLVEFLDKYADEDASFNAGAFELLKKRLQGGESVNTNAPLDDVVYPETTKVDHPDFASGISSDVVRTDSSKPRDLTEELKIASIELDIELPFEKTVTWHKRMHFAPDTSYVKPQPMCVDDEVRFVPVTLSGKKRDIYVISDLHFGSQYAVNAPKTVHSFLEKLAAASHEVHSVVLLGDVFELWDTKVYMPPPKVEDIVSHCLTCECVPEAVAIIKSLAEQHGVHVYYLPGNHDYRMTSELSRKVFGEKVEFIKGIMVMEIEECGETYRIRLEHGHDWDLFNSYALAGEPGGLLPGGENIGHFIGRSEATGDYSGSTTDCISSVLEKLEFNVLGTLLVKLLSTDYLQACLTTRLLERGNGKPIHPDQKFVLNDKGEYVTHGDLRKYKYVQRLINKFGVTRTLHMLRHALDDHSEFLETCDEDVVVLGHTHFKKCRVSRGRNRDVIHANSGAWVDYMHEKSYVKITPPRHCVRNGHGRVELNFMKERDTFGG